jgi:hypothetical protein
MIERPVYRHVPDATRATRRFHKSMSAAATAFMVSNRVSPRYAFRVWAEAQTPHALLQLAKSTTA